MYSIWLADDGANSSVIDMEYFKSSSAQFQRFLVRNIASFFSCNLNLLNETNGVYNSCSVLICLHHCYLFDVAYI